MYCPGKKLYVGMVVCISYLPYRKTDYKRLLIILVLLCVNMMVMSSALNMT